MSIRLAGRLLLHDRRLLSNLSFVKLESIPFHITLHNNQKPIDFLSGGYGDAHKIIIFMSFAG